MATVYDTWHKTHPRPTDKPCREHKGKYPTADHGKGKRWQVRYRDPSGEQRKLNFARRADADAEASRLDNDLNRGAYIDPTLGKETFREVGERWRASAVHGSSTVERVDRALRLHIYPILGDGAIAGFKTSEIQAWVKDRSKILAPSTLRVHYSYVTAIFRVAELDRQIPFNPTKGVKLPPPPRKEIVPLAVEVVAALVDAAPGWYRMLLLLAAASGLRQGELFGLELAHINFKRGTVQVKQQVVGPDRGEPYLAPPKTHESYRTVPVAKPAMDALAAHLEKYPARRVDIEDRTDPRPSKWKRRKALLVFTNERGEAIRRAAWASVWETLVRVADKALRKQYEGALKSWERRGRPADAEPTLRQVPDDATMHDLRHFYASVLIKHRESVKTVQKRLGHAKPSITLNTYTHLWPDEEDTTRAAIEAAFSAVPSLTLSGMRT
ncbi:MULTISPECIES: site-specific integrase [Kitasatospora]|uniref:Integrase n=1 Tax=Kitasatospora setae (strain ATCC 33774 / DSM 43861 / JCM 3304 / KCC A-0304 / NBRC 14216 / KM-6054) TaxID=452652 RepID=E4NCV3_KITSK|nr:MULTISPECIES: site-specific integrase [Kitasatospora]BAJ29034.1 hypothetical protein KSE_32240 [Kitasatospora setae KM-6054]